MGLVTFSCQLSPGPSWWLRTRSRPPSEARRVSAVSSLHKRGASPRGADRRGDARVGTGPCTETRPRLRPGDTGSGAVAPVRSRGPFAALWPSPSTVPPTRRAPSLGAILGSPAPSLTQHHRAEDDDPGALSNLTSGLSAARTRLTLCKEAPASRRSPVFRALNKSQAKRGVPAALIHAPENTVHPQRPGSGQRTGPAHTVGEARSPGPKPATRQGLLGSAERRARRGAVPGRAVTPRVHSRTGIAPGRAGLQATSEPPKAPSGAATDCRR